MLMGLAINLKTWATLYWIIYLFSCFNSALNNGHLFNRKKLLYLYSIVKPEMYILAKIFKQTVIVFLIGIIGFVTWMIFGVEFQNIGLFVPVVFLNSLIMASILSLVSFISVKAEGNFALLAILALPILIPDLLIVSKLSYLILDGFSSEIYLKYIGSLALLSFISCALSIVLFPYIWRE